MSLFVYGSLRPDMPVGMATLRIGHLRATPALVEGYGLYTNDVAWYPFVLRTPDAHVMGYVLEGVSSFDNWQVSVMESRAGYIPTGVMPIGRDGRHLGPCVMWEYIDDGVTQFRLISHGDWARYIQETEEANAP